MNIESITKVGKSAFKVVKAFTFDHRHLLLTVASTVANVGAIVYISTKTEETANAIQERRMEKGSEPTTLEKTGIMVKHNWPAYAMVGAGTTIDILHKKNLLSSNAALALTLANQTKAKEALEKAINENLPKASRDKVNKAANEEYAKEQISDMKRQGVYRDYIPSVGRGSTIFLYEGILFKADMNDVAAAYEDVKRVASDPMNKGIVTRKDFLDSVAIRGGRPTDDMPWARSESLDCEGWTCYLDGYSGVSVPDVWSNLNDEDLYVPADRCGFYELGKEPIAVLRDNASVVSDEAKKRSFENY